MDKPHQPHVIRTWTVERTRHQVRDLRTNPPASNRKFAPPRREPPKK